MSKGASHLTVARLLAVSLLMCGLGSALATVVPVRFGNVDWEFGTLGELAATSALPVMGLAAVLAVSIYDRRRWAARMSGVLMLVLGLVGFGAIAVLVTDTPIILSAAGNLQGTESTSVKVVLAKSLGLFLLFSLGLIGTGIGALRSVQRGR